MSKVIIEVSLTDEEIIQALDEYCHNNNLVSDRFKITESYIYSGKLTFSDESYKNETAVDELWEKSHG